jgi:hypothetical protein
VSGAECRGERDEGEESACDGVPRQESKCEAPGNVPKGLRHRSLANLGLTGSQPKRVARTAGFVSGLQAALILAANCGRMTGKPEVIRRRTLDRIGGFPPARREIVPKSACGKGSPHVASIPSGRRLGNGYPPRERGEKTGSTARELANSGTSAIALAST